jgi:hypothetical protein
MPFGCEHRGEEQSILRGKVVVPSSLGRGESCEFEFARGSFKHQKCSNYALTNLLFSLCKFV